MITLLGTIIFTTIIGIGSLDSRSGLSLFGKYTASGVAAPHSRSTTRRKGEGPNEIGRGPAR